MTVTGDRFASLYLPECLRLWDCFSLRQPLWYDLLQTKTDRRSVPLNE